MASTSSTLHWPGATRALAVPWSLCGAMSPMTLLSGQHLAYHQLTVTCNTLFAAAAAAAAAVIELQWYNSTVIQYSGSELLYCVVVKLR